MNFQEYGAAVSNELAQVFQRMDDESVMPLINALKGANRVFALGSGREGISMRPFIMRLAHLGFTAHWGWDDTTVACNPGDIYITSSSTGGIKGAGYYHATKAKAAGATIVLLTAKPDSEFAEFADIVVFIPASAWKVRTGVVPTIQLMGNQYEQAEGLVLDIVIMMLREQLGISEAEMEARHRNIE